MFRLKVFARLEIEERIKQLVMRYSSKPKKKQSIILPDEGKKLILPRDQKIIVPPLHVTPPPTPRQVLSEDTLRVYRVPREFEEEETIQKIPPVSWVQLGAITQHRYQGRFFHTCWAFAPSVASSAKHFIETQTLYELSVQFVVDKTPSRGIGRGDHVKTWFKIALENKGVPLWGDYPYVLPAFPAGYESAPIVDFGLKGYHSLDTSNILEILKTVQKQPVIVSFPVFEEYEKYEEGQIITTYTASPSSGIHATVIVDYMITPGGLRYFVHKDSFKESIEFFKISIDLEIYTKAYIPTHVKKSIFLGQGKKTVANIPSQQLPRLPRIDMPHMDPTTSEEDLQLTIAWCRISTDPAAGVGQKSANFWERVLELFLDSIQEKTGSRPDGNLGACENRMQEILAAVSKWKGIRAQVFRGSARQSGTSLVDLEALVRQRWADEHDGKQFEFEACYDVLKKQGPIWFNYNEAQQKQKRSASRLRRKTNLQPTGTPPRSDTNEETHDSENIDLEHPLGQKKLFTDASQEQACDGEKKKNKTKNLKD